LQHKVPLHCKVKHRRSCNTVPRNRFWPCASRRDFDLCLATSPVADSWSPDQSTAVTTYSRAWSGLTGGSMKPTRSRTRPGRTTAGFAVGHDVMRPGFGLPHPRRGSAARTGAGRSSRVPRGSGGPGRVRGTVRVRAGPRSAGPRRRTRTAPQERSWLPPHPWRPGCRRCRPVRRFRNAIHAARPSRAIVKARLTQVPLDAEVAEERAWRRGTRGRADRPVVCEISDAMCEPMSSGGISWPVHSIIVLAVVGVDAVGDPHPVRTLQDAEVDASAAGRARLDLQAGVVPP
jgi:hypothetical protein